MTNLRVLRAGLIAAVLSVVLNGNGFAQSAAPVEPAKAMQAGTQQVFRITPVRPIAELRAEALKAKPPEEQGTFEPSKLVDLVEVSDSIEFEIRYATNNNFLGEPVYEEARAFLEASAANALKRVSRKVLTKGYGLLVYDAYRPWFVTKIFWDATPKEQREFVSDPAKGSIHNRGCAVDLTLYDRKTGAAVAMPSGYDEMTPRAYADYDGASADEKEHRAILREAMESEGFIQRPNEWWHYDYKDWQKYAIANLPFESIPHRVGVGVKPPRLKRNVSPEFSDEARRRNKEGTVRLRLTVDENGKPMNIVVVRGIGYGLDEQAVRAVEQWRFEPATKDGVPVKFEISAEINFHNKF